MDVRLQTLGLSLATLSLAGASHVTATDPRIVIPFTAMAPLPQLVGRVDGRRANLVIDTGGPGLDLSPAFARTLGIETKSTGRAAFAGGLRAKIRSGRIDRLTLGGATLRSVPVNVPPLMPPGVDGVVGTGVLARFLATIDYPHHRLDLRARSASRVFEAAAKARGDIIVPMILRGHEIVVRARVDHAPETSFVVDTGGPGIGVDLTKAELAAAAIAPDAAHPTTILGGGGPTVTLPFTANVTLGGVVFSNVPGVYLPAAERHGAPRGIGGRLSQELFDRGALTFDFTAMKLVFAVRR